MKLHVWEIDNIRYTILAEDLGHALAKIQSKYGNDGALYLFASTVPVVLESDEDGIYTQFVSLVPASPNF